jgi:PAS domain S-box-containing protein
MNTKPSYQELENELAELKEKLVFLTNFNNNIYQNSQPKRHSCIFDESPFALEHYNEQGKLVDVNSKCLEIFGITNFEEIKDFELFENPNISDEVKETIKKGIPYNYETVFDFELVKKHKLYKTTKSGISYLKLWITPIMNNLLKKYEYIIHIEDITEWKKNEEKSQILTEINNAIIANSPIGISIFNSKGDCIQANESIAFMIGGTKESIQTQNYFKLKSWKETGLLEIALTTIKENKINKIELNTGSSFGKKINLEIILTPITLLNEKHLLLMTKDNSKQKDAENKLIEEHQKLTNILNAFDDSIYKCSPDFDITYLNPSMIKEIGRNAIGEKCYKAIFNQDSPCSWCYFDKLKNEKTKITLEVKREKKNYLISAILLENNSKLTIYHDITELKKNEIKLKTQNEEYATVNEELLASADELKDLNTELIKAKDKAQESDKLKTEFLQNMSHEIRTPMNGILGFSKLLKNSDKPEEKKQQYTNIIISCGNQLMRIVDDILEISRLETKQISIINNKICINSTLFDLFHIFRSIVKERNLELYVKNGLSDEKCRIITDESKIIKIISNLIENAIKFTHEGYIEFGYKLKNKKNKLEFYIKDTGIGIAKDKHRTIFDRFSQEEKELSKNVGGLGLGLSIAKENAKLLGGKIWVESEKGKGSTFFFTIPYKPIIDNSLQKETENFETQKRKHKILIVEDDEINFLYLETLLVEEKDFLFDIYHAKNGNEALEIFDKTKNIELILMDLKLPIMSGIEATKKLRKKNAEIPIIAQSAYTMKKDIEEALNAGCNDFISKPINEKIFREMINKHL